MIKLSLTVHFSDGQTVAGAFGFRFGNDPGSDEQQGYGDKKLAELRNTLGELKLIIIEEVSLISSDMLYKIDAKLKEIFHLRSKTPFGGVGVMFVGDLLQIPPVKGKYIFQPPNNPKNLKAFQNLGLWKLFEPWILKHNHRQGEGGEWANCLNRLRMGIVTEEDLKCLKSRETEDPIHDVNAVHLCFTNLETEDHNGKMNELMI